MRPARLSVSIARQQPRTLLRAHQRSPPPPAVHAPSLPFRAFAIATRPLLPYRRFATTQEPIDSPADSEQPPPRPQPTEGDRILYSKALEAGDTGELIRLVEETGIDVNLQPAAAGARTALHVAAAKADLSACAQLIEHEAKADLADINGQTPVDLAVRCGNREVAKLLLGWQLLQRGDEIIGAFLKKSYHRNPSVVRDNLLRTVLPTTPEKAQLDFFGACQSGDLFTVQTLWFFSSFPIQLDHKVGEQLALFIACSKGHRKIAEFLLDMGADPNAWSARGVTALEAAIEQGEEETVSLLLSKGADPGSNSGAPLLRAVAKGEAAIVELLIGKGAHVRVQAGDGTTPMHLAALHGDAAVAALLLKHGAVLDAKSHTGATPLFTAALQGHAPIVKMLLAAGVSPKRGAGPAAHAHSLASPLFVAAHEGHLEIVKMLLDAGAESNELCQMADGQVASPLFVAALNGSSPLVSLLLQAGANPNGVAAPGAVPPLAAALAHPVVLQQLLAAGASPDIHFSSALFGAEPAVEITPLSMAAAEGATDIVRALLAARADPKLLQGDGKSPLRVAMERGHTDIAALLRTAGAS